MVTIAILDYGMGNLRSIEKGFEKVGFDARIIGNGEEIKPYDALVVPGVGAFGDAMRNLERSGSDKAILDYVASGKKVLGICLGMQLFFEESEEHGLRKGLGIIKGRVERLPGNVKVPHMGWNIVLIKKICPIFHKIQSGSRFYFVHSYYCKPNDESCVIATTPYGVEFASAVNKENVWGVQFHPEKSSTSGLKILENFGKMVVS